MLAVFGCKPDVLGRAPCACACRHWEASQHEGRGLADTVQDSMQAATSLIWGSSHMTPEQLQPDAEGVLPLLPHMHGQMQACTLLVLSNRRPWCGVKGIVRHHLSRKCLLHQPLSMIYTYLYTYAQIREVLAIDPGTWTRGTRQPSCCQMYSFDTFFLLAGASQNHSMVKGFVVPTTLQLSNQACALTEISIMPATFAQHQ